MGALRWLVCFMLGHPEQKMHQDGKGAAWHVCPRCKAVTGSHSYHGGRPWE